MRSSETARTVAALLLAGLCAWPSAGRLRGSTPGGIPDELRFSSRVRTDLGHTPAALAIADFDADDLPDLVTTSGQTDDVRVWLGQGSGAFTESVRLPTENDPNAVLAADLDGDGNQDIVVATYWAAGIFVYLGRGDGTFEDGSRYATAPQPVALACADFDGDGFLDLVSGHDVGDGLAFLPGNGDGSFDTIPTIPSTESPGDLVVADFDGNGSQDVAGAGGVVFLGDGSGGFAPHPAFPPQGFLAVADVNHDGDADLATAGGHRAGVTIHLGNGDGSFRRGGTFGTREIGPLRLRDIDTDGNVDVIGSADAPGDVLILLGDGDGTFSTTRLVDSVSAIVALEVGDLDGNGRLDLVLASGGFSSLTAHINESDPGETRFRAEVVESRFEPVVCGRDVSVWQADATRADVVPATIDVVLDTEFEPCAADPTGCDGGENVYLGDAAAAGHGCGDGVDNDGDGLLDADDPDCVGVSGWTLALDVDACFGLRQATFDGTVAQARPAGVLDVAGGGFARTELLEEAAGVVRVVSTVMLSVDRPAVLPAVSESIVLRLAGELRGEDFVFPAAAGCTATPRTEPCGVTILPAPATIVATRREELSPSIASAAILLHLSDAPPPPRRATLRIRQDPEFPLQWKEQPDDGGATFVLTTSSSSTPASLEVVLESAIEPCYSVPQLCVGAENFVEYRGAEEVHGCEDGEDNDQDGLTDLEDPDCVGIEGWTYSLLMEDCFRVERATTEGTIADLEHNGGLRDPGGSFERTELVDPLENGGRRGLVSSVILSTVRPEFLPHESTAIVLRLAGSVHTDENGDACTLRFAEDDAEALVSEGESVPTAVSIAGEAATPSVCSAGFRTERSPESTVGLTFRLVSPAAIETRLGPSLDRAWTVVAANAEALDVQVDAVVVSRMEPCLEDPVRCNGGEAGHYLDERGDFLWPCSDELDNDEDGLIDAEDPDCFGVQGWSFSVVTQPCFDVIGATLRGTCADLALRPPGKSDPEGRGFESTEVVNPDFNGGAGGCVTAHVMSYTNLVVLPPASDSAVMRIFGRLDPSRLGPGEVSEPCGLFYFPPGSPGLRGSVEPVLTTTWVMGEEVQPEVSSAAISVARSTEVFVRGDANDDDRVDISDAVATLNGLFRAAGTISCHAALDSNADDTVDISDAVYLLNFLFLGGPVLPPPHPGCGGAPNSLGCDSFGSCS